MDMKVKSVITNSWRSPVNLSLKIKEEYFSILHSDLLWKLSPPLPAGMSKCQASQLLFTVDLSAFSASLAIQNV
jgi:hypothetical protein